MTSFEDDENFGSYSVVGSFPKDFGYGPEDQDELASSDNKPRILLLGLRRSGKSSIQKVVFHKMSPNETLFLESTNKIVKDDISNSSFVQFQIWDFPGQIDFFDPAFDSEVLFGHCGALVFVIDAQDDYMEALGKLHMTVTRAYKVNPNIKFEVFIHKVDGLSDDHKIETQRDIHQRATDELADAGLEGLHLSFYLTSIYDHSIFEAFSKVVQKLVPQLPTLENLLNILITNSVASNDSVPPPPSQGQSNNVCCWLNNIIFGQKNAAQTSIQHAVSVLNTTTQELRGISIEDKDDVAFTMEEVEDIFITLAEEKLNETSPKLAYKNNQFDFRVRRVFTRQRNVEEFFFNGTKGNYMKIPSRNFHHGSVVLGVTYNNIHELFISNHSANISKPNQTRWLNTIIMSGVIYPWQDALVENVTLVFKSIKAAGKNRECVFWNFSEENPEGWSGKGCITRIINSSLTECLCNHLTHFAVLMDYADSGDNGGPTLPSKKDDKILTILTRVGMSLSLTGVVITIISYLLLTNARGI